MQSNFRAPTGGGYQTAQLPPVDFRYGPLSLDDTLQVAGPTSVGNLSGDFGGIRRRWVDLEGRACRES